MKSSLTSVTFRKKTPEQIVYLTKQARLDAIEWGGDIHVPAGDKAAAEHALRLCRDNGIEISAYGSYFYAGQDNNFQQVLETAQRLQCRVIRVWTGRIGSQKATAEQRAICTQALAEMVAMAQQVGCTVATEYHSNTLTDTLASARELLRDVPGLKTFWQPPDGLTVQQNLEALEQLKGQVENVHVYYWQGYERYPLADGAGEWRYYLQKAADTGISGYATLEFVKDDSQKQLMEDARTLRELLSQLG